MKNIKIIIASLILFGTTAVYAAPTIEPAVEPTIIPTDTKDTLPTPQELEFEPVGGGKYIYCNNPEAIGSDTLVNGDKPRYVMNNENLTPGKYYIYLSHFNYIGDAEVAKDMELDVELTPVSEMCEYTISNIGFETGHVLSWHENGKWIKYEPEWGMLNTCAQAMNKTICDIDGEAYYPRKDNNPVQHIQDNKTRWLSEFIDNYNKTHYMQPVHMQAVLEITSGTMNVNVCAFESGDTVGDRSTFRRDAEFGIHRRDRCIKGIADTMPQVEAKLEYEIDDRVSDGTFLPVIMHNSYAPDGIVVNEWFTHINPLDDPWAKALADESGMIRLTYKDDSKLKYYGKNVKSSDKNNIWEFDTRHTDTHEYKTEYGGKADDYIPNFKIDASSNASGYASNLGNYGVTYTYDLSITNNGNSTRFFTYEPTTNSNIIVYTNENGTDSEYALTKKLYSEARTDIMSAVKLPPGKTTEFTVNVILPVNYNGGIKNGFVIRDNVQQYNIPELISKTSSRVYDTKPINGKYLSDYKNKLPKSTLDFFKGTLDCYEILDCKDFYAVRWCVWDGKYNYYYPGWWLCSHVYFLDKDMKVNGHYTFNSMPVGMSYNNNILYIQTAANGIMHSENGNNWVLDTSMTELPQNQIPQKNIVLGDVIKTNNTNSHIIKNNVYQAALNDDEYSIIYEEIKDVKLKKSENTQTHKTNIFLDGINISSGFMYDSENYVIAAEDDMNKITDILSNILIFKNDELMAQELKISDWAKNDIKTAYEYGIVPLNAKKYIYTNSISREQFCTIAANVIKYTNSLKLPETSGEFFLDTSDKDVAALSELGIITGYEDKTFKPQKSITREEAAAIISRMIKLYNLEEENNISYTDENDIQSWAKQGVKIANRYGIMNGVGNNLFAPQGAYTIEQSIVTMLRTFNTITDAGYLNLPTLPSGGSRCTVYREGYRNNRIEIAVYDTEKESKLINSDGILTVDGSYKNDVKYYFSRGKWIEFEKNYDKISNNATAVLMNINLQ